MQSKWTLRLATAVLWALAAGSLVFWGLRLGGPGGAGAPSGGAQARDAQQPALPTDSAATQVAIAKFLGASNSVATAQAPVPTANRFSLAGVVAQGSGGAALLAVDGKPPKPYRVGARIEDGVMLQSVGARHAVLAASTSGPPLQRLEMPPAGAPSKPAMVVLGGPTPRPSP